MSNNDKIVTAFATGSGSRFMLVIESTTFRHIKTTAIDETDITKDAIGGEIGLAMSSRVSKMN